MTDQWSKFLSLTKNLVDATDKPNVVIKKNNEIENYVKIITILEKFKKEMSFMVKSYKELVDKVSLLEFEVNKLKKKKHKQVKRNKKS